MPSGAPPDSTSGSASPRSPDGTGKVMTAVNIESLPLELNEMITEYLDIRERGHLRLLSRNLNHKILANKEFRRCFYYRRVNLSRKPLKRLSRLTQQASMVCLMRSLDISKNVKDLIHGFHMTTCFRVKNALRALFHSSELITQLLTQVFQNLRKHSPDGFLRRLEFTTDLPHTLDYFGGEIHRIVRAISALAMNICVTALEQAELPVHVFNVSIRGYYCNVIPCIRPRPDQSTSMPTPIRRGPNVFLQNLKTLDLSHDGRWDFGVIWNLRPSRDANDEISTNTIRRSARFPSLQDLGLWWHPVRWLKKVGIIASERGSLERLLSLWTLPSLENLMLGGVRISEMILFEFLQRHRSLRTLRLRRIELTEGRWRRVFDLISDSSDHLIEFHGAYLWEYHSIITMGDACTAGNMLSRILRHKPGLTEDGVKNTIRYKNPWDV